MQSTHPAEDATSVECDDSYRREVAVPSTTPTQCAPSVECDDSYRRQTPMQSTHPAEDATSVECDDSYRRKTIMMNDTYLTFTHNPPHYFKAGATYMITAATYQKRPHIATDERKRQWIDSFHFVLKKEGWAAIAYVVLNNHYHVIIGAPPSGADRLSVLIASLHRFTAREWNNADETPGRTVWWNYWDTCLTNEASFCARINYIHWNPVKHGLAAQPEAYLYGTYRIWMQQQHDELRRLESSFPFDRVSVYDDF